MPSARRPAESQGLGLSMAGLLAPELARRVEEPKRSSTAGTWSCQRPAYCARNINKVEDHGSFFDPRVFLWREKSTYRRGTSACSSLTVTSWKSSSSTATSKLRSWRLGAIVFDSESKRPKRYGFIPSLKLPPFLKIRSKLLKSTMSRHLSMAFPPL